MQETMDTSYICKTTKGRESPKLVKNMAIMIKVHKKWNAPDFYSDICFKNYVTVIGDKLYVAYKFTPDRIYFKFYDESEDDLRRFKLFYYGKESSASFGDLLAINVCNKPEISNFYSELWYPVYYLISSDEYFIKLEDGKRKSLFDANSIERDVQNMETKNHGYLRSFKIDPIKLVALLKKTGNNMSACSREMGYSEGALSCALRVGAVSYGMADRLAKNFRIYKEDYEFVEKIEEPEVESVDTSKIEFVISETTKTELKEIIYSAMYEAMKRALSE